MYELLHVSFVKIIAPKTPYLSESNRNCTVFPLLRMFDLVGYFTFEPQVFFSEYLRRLMYTY